MDTNPEKQNSNFFHENFIAPGAKVWVQGAYKYAGIILILYSVLLIPIAVLAFLLPNRSYQIYCYALVGSSFLLAITLGFGSFKTRSWTIPVWITTASAFLIGLFIIPYGFELWTTVLFSACIAATGFAYRKTFIKGSLFGILLSMVGSIAAVVFVIAIARPELLGGPTQSARQYAVATFFVPASFIKDNKGKEAVMQLYGYSEADVLSGTVTDQQLLQKIQQNPQPFNSLINSINHTFYGYVDSVVLALLPSGIV